MEDKQRGDNTKRHLTEEQMQHVFEKVYKLWQHEIEIWRERERLYGRTVHQR